MSEKKKKKKKKKKKIKINNRCYSKLASNNTRQLSTILTSFKKDWNKKITNEIEKMQSMIIFMLWYIRKWDLKILTIFFKVKGREKQSCDNCLLRQWLINIQKTGNDVVNPFELIKIQKMAF